MKFATDLDMVLADSHSVWLTGLAKRYGSFSLNHYRIKIKGTHWKKISDFINRSLLAHSEKIKPIQTSVNALPEIMDFFKQLYLPIISSRQSYLYDCTKAWCKANLPVPFKLFLTNDSKLKIIEDNDITVFADDRFETINEISPIISTAFLIDQKWNQGRPEILNVIRVNNLQEALEYLKNDNLQKIPFQNKEGSPSNS